MSALKYNYNEKVQSVIYFSWQITFNLLYLIITKQMWTEYCMDALHWTYPLASIRQYGAYKPEKAGTK